MITAIMAIGSILWAYHDCYFWDKTTKSVVDKYGWHNIKTAMMLFTFASVYLLGHYHWLEIGPVILITTIRWSAFEFGMALATRDKCYAEFGDWFYAVKLIFDQPKIPVLEMEIKRRDSNLLEFIGHYCFRLNWIESLIVLITTEVVWYVCI